MRPTVCQQGVQDVGPLSQYGTCRGETRLGAARSVLHCLHNWQHQKDSLIASGLSLQGYAPGRSAAQKLRWVLQGARASTAREGCATGN